jgi:hypothetical protein
VDNRIRSSGSSFASAHTTQTIAAIAIAWPAIRAIRARALVRAGGSGTSGGRSRPAALRTSHALSRPFLMRELLAQTPDDGERVSGRETSLYGRAECTLNWVPDAEVDRGAMVP